MADWGELVPDILFMIAKQIEDVEDFVSFCSVCSTWRAIRLYKGSMQSLKPLWWLVFSPPHKSHRIREFYSFTKDKFYRVLLPEKTAKLKLVVTNGWILTLSPEPKMSLLHPFPRHVITLPSKTTSGFDLRDVRKATLSSSPFLSPNDYSLMIIFGKMCQLGFWKLGDKAWTVIETYNAPFEDVMYCKGQFYAIDKQGVIYVCDIRGCNNSTIAVSINEIPLGLGDHSLYLARRTANQDLLIVSRYNSLWEDYADKTNPFKVYEINLCGKGVERVKDLGARTIFLSSDQAFCVENSKFPSGIVDHYHSSYNYSDNTGGSYNSPYGYTVSKHPFKERIHMLFYNLKDENVKSFCYSLE